MAAVKDDIQTSSDWIAHAMSSSGYRADFSPASCGDFSDKLGQYAVSVLVAESNEGRPSERERANNPRGDQIRFVLLWRFGFWSRLLDRRFLHSAPVRASYEAGALRGRDTSARRVESSSRCR
jgi:hypothetical protein